ACVFLDLSALKPEFIKDRFPSLYERCLSHGVDMTREFVPVVPAAHFSCGGVHTDLHGRTYVLHLNAIGETGCTGLHGANRLARARRILLELREEIQSFYWGCRPSRPLIDLRNAIQTSLLVVHAAALNPRSKGCHTVIDSDE